MVPVGTSRLPSGLVRLLTIVLWSSLAPLESYQGRLDYAEYIQASEFWDDYPQGYFHCIKSRLFTRLSGPETDGPETRRLDAHCDHSDLIRQQPGILCSSLIDLQP